MKSFYLNKNYLFITLLLIIFILTNNVSGTISKDEHNLYSSKKNAYDDIISNHENIDSFGKNYNQKLDLSKNNTFDSRHKPNQKIHRQDNQKKTNHIRRYNNHDSNIKGPLPDNIKNHESDYFFDSSRKLSRSLATTKYNQSDNNSKENHAIYKKSFDLKKKTLEEHFMNMDEQIDNIVKNLDKLEEIKKKASDLVHHTKSILDELNRNKQQYEKEKKEMKDTEENKDRIKLIEKMIQGTNNEINKYQKSLDENEELLNFLEIHREKFASDYYHW